jgi:predicted  nucleic acid-binding Zn-ribbon protein
MRRNTVGFMLIVAGLAAGAALRGGVSAQGPQGPQERDVLPALLTEVRGLRAAMERMASAGPRVQLALGRLQLQEQRVNNLLRRLETARASLANVQRDDEGMRRGLAGMEESLKSMTEPAQIKGVEQELRAIKERLPGLAAEVQRLQVEESGIVQEIVTEQGRWTDINQRLEELERTLSGGR